MIFVTSIRLTFSSSKYNERQKTLTDFSVDSINPKQRLFPIITDLPPGTFARTAASLSFND